MQELVRREVIIQVLQEVLQEITNNGISPREKAFLFHQKGSLLGLIGQAEQQKEAWLQAQILAPDCRIIRVSLQSLEK
ncbi:MAG: hypothetical protein A2Y67_03750 [Candidatus Buchananbacteria bacterium RBG_13_39_9]|uniref:Uncharacterized protein n=1 Tax=Candidatus Buchananbacteria bacterium RBG_13_39_9 TaxID=1797531 RepID=A0A1G1XS53_9BACT|nr:MAG: hypothetical protein A2Y67_03750 [Candidatus Buchananbacteria bacterium RBG_13_39_9]